MDALDDIAVKTNSQGQGLKQSEKEAKRAASVAEGGVVYKLLKSIDVAVGNYGKDGFAVGSSLTVADLMLYTSSCNLVR